MKRSNSSPNLQQIKSETPTLSTDLQPPLVVTGTQEQNESPQQLNNPTIKQVLPRRTESFPPRTSPGAYGWPRPPQREYKSQIPTARHLAHNVYTQPLSPPQASRSPRRVQSLPMTGQHGYHPHYQPHPQYHPILPYGYQPSPYAPHIAPIPENLPMVSPLGPYRPPSPPIKPPRSKRAKVVQPPDQNNVTKKLLDIIVKQNQPTKPQSELSRKSRNRKKFKKAQDVSKQVGPALAAFNENKKGCCTKFIEWMFTFGVCCESNWIWVAQFVIFMITMLAIGAFILGSYIYIYLSRIDDIITSVNYRVAPIMMITSSLFVFILGTWIFYNLSYYNSFLDTDVDDRTFEMVEKIDSRMKNGRKLCVIMIMISAGLSIHYVNKTIGGYSKGFRDFLKFYSSDIEVKKDVDETQIRFDCCGSDGYQDWFKIERFDKVKIHRTVPYSCCNPDSVDPCVFADVPPGNFTIHTVGCSERFEEQTYEGRQAVIWILSLILGLSCFLLINIRYLETGFYEKYVLLSPDPHSYLFPK